MRDKVMLDAKSLTLFKLLKNIIIKKNNHKRDSRYWYTDSTNIHGY